MDARLAEQTMVLRLVHACMRQRAELIGANFEVRSRPDSGTVVWLAIPLREESR